MREAFEKRNQCLAPYDFRLGHGEEGLAPVHRITAGTVTRRAKTALITPRGRSGAAERATCSEISSNAAAILRVGLAVMLAQIFFLAQDLTVEQPCGRAQSNQSCPIREDEEFSDQDDRKGHINGIATEGKNAVGYESVGMVSVNADSKALPKGNQAPQEQQQPRQAKQHSGPRDDLGLEKLVRRHGRPVECRGEQDIEIEQGKWRNQEICLVYTTEFHRLYALPSQDGDSGQYHPKPQNDCEWSEIFRHLNCQTIMQGAPSCTFRYKFAPR